MKGKQVENATMIQRVVAREALIFPRRKQVKERYPYGQCYHQYWTIPTMKHHWRSYFIVGKEVDATPLFNYMASSKYPSWTESCNYVDDKVYEESTCLKGKEYQKDNILQQETLQQVWQVRKAWETLEEDKSKWKELVAARMGSWSMHINAH